MTLIGSGGKPELLVLPLTRFGDDEAFQLPVGSDYPRLGPTNEGYL